MMKYWEDSILKKSYKKTVIAFCVLFGLFALITVLTGSDFPRDYKSKNPPVIHLYGETHGKKEFYDIEFEAWKNYYEKGNRILFVELPYYSAEYLNLWMRETDDAILEELYQDWKGTNSYVPAYKEFFSKIKSVCPETIFYGTDVGHQYKTTGKRYLTYLEEMGLADTEQYFLAKECVYQGAEFSGKSATDPYREKKMIENFVDAFNRVGQKEIFGIYGSYHVDPRNSKLMAGQLKQILGDIIESNYILNLIAKKRPFTFGFGYMGLIFLLMMFIPNIIFSRNLPENYMAYAKQENKFLQVIEKIGEVAVTFVAVIFTDFNPFVKKLDGFIIFPLSNLYLVLAFVLMVLYEIYWIRYFKSNHTMKDFYADILGIPLAGATLPVITFLILGIFGKNLAMIIAAIILGIGHIGIHYQHYKKIS